MYKSKKNSFYGMNFNIFLTSGFYIVFVITYTLKLLRSSNFCYLVERPVTEHPPQVAHMGAAGTGPEVDPDNWKTIRQDIRRILVDSVLTCFSLYKKATLTGDTEKTG